MYVRDMLSGGLAGASRLTVVASGAMGALNQMAVLEPWGLQYLGNDTYARYKLIVSFA